MDKNVKKNLCSVDMGDADVFVTAVTDMIDGGDDMARSYCM